MGMAPSAIFIQPETTNHKLDYIAQNYDDVATNGHYAKNLVQRVLKEHIALVNTDTCEPNEEDAFYVADLGEVYRQHLRWKMNLTRVKPFYGTFNLSVCLLKC